MHSCGKIAVLTSALLTVGLAWGQTSGPRQPVRSRAQVTSAAGIVPMLSTISTFRVNGTTTPAAITFTANNPGGTIAGSATALLDMNVPNQNHNPWTITVQATTSSMNCGTATPVPVSAITVTCSGAYKPGSHGGTVACSGAFALSSSSAQTIVSGTLATTNGDYGATVTFTLNDSWNYIATTGQSCSVNINYVATAQ